MTSELQRGIPFKIRAGVEIQDGVTVEGSFATYPHDTPARILSASDQKYPTQIAVYYLHTDSRNPKNQSYELGYLPFPENYRDQLMNVLSKLEKLNFDPNSTPTAKVRMELLAEAQTAIFQLEQSLPKTESGINPVIFGLKAGFNEFINNPDFNPF